METTRKRACQVLNRDLIKYLAMVTMLLNHIATIFLESGTPLAEIFLDLGYFTAPVMCFFLVEGYHYTRSKRNYALRLALFAVLSELPYCLAMTHRGVLEFCGLNMIFTLLLCFGILAVLEKVSNLLLRVLLILGLTALSLISDWALLAPVMTLLFAWAHGSGAKTKAAFGISAVLFGLVNFVGCIGRYSPGLSAVYALGGMAGIVLAGVAAAVLYNGTRMERGKTFSQWFFYLFYPVHLLVLGVIRICLS